MCEDMNKNGGIEYYEEQAEKKSSYLYEFIDNSSIRMMEDEDCERRKLCYKNDVDMSLRSR